jgi:hypothetical protein
MGDVLGMVVWCSCVLLGWSGFDWIGSYCVVLEERQGWLFVLVLVLYCIGPELTAEYLYSPSTLALPSHYMQSKIKHAMPSNPENVGAGWASAVHI